MTTPSGFPPSRGMFGLNGSAKTVGVILALAVQFAAIVASNVTMRTDINYLREDLKMYQEENLRLRIEIAAHAAIAGHQTALERTAAVKETQVKLEARIKDLEQRYRKPNGG